MSSTPPREGVSPALLNQAWAALAQGDHALACELLAPYATQTTEDLQLAEVWASMLGAVDDERHLSYELERLAGRWAEEPRVVLAIAQSASRWASRALPLQPPPSTEPLPVQEGDTLAERRLQPVLWLAAQVVTFCLEHAAPSEAEGRATLYLARAHLLCWGGAEAEEGALGDLEVALSLSPALGEGWYLLARLHLSRARWEKALAAQLQAREVGLGGAQLTWLELVARTGLGGDAASRCPELWAELNHDGLTLGSGGRAVKRGYEPQLVALHSHMVGPSGVYDQRQEWALERVWVQPLSPCHGRVLHPTLQPLPAGYDDLVIWDPQPATFIEHEGDERPVLRAIACLERGRAHSRPLPKAQLTSAQLEALNERLPKGVFYYQAPHAPQGPQGALCWPRGEALAPLLQRLEVSWCELGLPTIS